MSSAIVVSVHVGAFMSDLYNDYSRNLRQRLGEPARCLSGMPSRLDVIEAYDLRNGVSVGKFRPSHGPSMLTAKEVSVWKAAFKKATWWSVTFMIEYRNGIIHLTAMPISKVVARCAKTFIAALGLFTFILICMYVIYIAFRPH